MALTGTEVKCAEILATNKAYAANADQAITTTTTTILSLEAKGKNMILCVVPSAAGSLVVLKGNGYAATKDASIALTASKANFIELDTAPFLNVEGDDKGYINVRSDGTLAGKIHTVSVL